MGDGKERLSCEKFYYNRKQRNGSVAGGSVDRDTGKLLKMEDIMACCYAVVRI